MFILNGKPLSIDVPFKHNDVQYPANWLRMTTLEEKQAIGISEVPDPEIYDDRYYWSAGNPKDLTQCKTNLINQIKQTASTLLSPTDWKIIRAVETGTFVSPDTLAQRAAIRQASNVNESAVNACTTVDQLASLQLNWPVSE